MDRKRRKQSEETKAKISAGNKGKIVSEETKEKLRRRKQTEETKAKISAGNKGKIVSEETKEKLRKARAKQIITDETKKKLSNSLINYWKNVIWINEDEIKNKELNSNANNE